jgi:hypothetical protein
MKAWLAVVAGCAVLLGAWSTGGVDAQDPVRTAQAKRQPLARQIQPNVAYPASRVGPVSASDACDKTRCGPVGRCGRVRDPKDTKLYCYTCPPGYLVDENLGCYSCPVGTRLQAGACR